MTHTLKEKLWWTNFSFRVWVIPWRKNSDGKTLTEKLWWKNFVYFFSFFPIFTSTKRLNFIIFMLDLLCHEKTRKMKKTFCFNNCSCYILRKNLSSFDFSFSQVTSVEEREPRGTFLSLGLRPRLQKTFPRFPFFYWGNLGKTKIRRGHIFSKIVARTIIETEFP